MNLVNPRGLNAYVLIISSPQMWQKRSSMISLALINHSKKNEFGDVGLKAVYERLSEISPGYKAISDYFSSDDFNKVIQDICGDETVFWGGETMYGGGTHENLNGIELDQHVDFNYNDLTKEHRRLNLLIYLNPIWSEEWGGGIWSSIQILETQKKTT